MPLLYVDMLGMKARYHRGGTRAAQSGYRLLAELVQQGLEALPDGHAVRGGVQSDAVCLQFASAVDAVLVGRKLFADTFRRSNRSNLLWVRGVIVQGEPEMAIETTKQLQGSTPEVFVREFAPPLVRAIHAEQSGFHGQRLLIESKLASQEKVDQALRQEIGNGHLSPTHRLRYSKYPPPTGRYRDVLWPVPENLKDWPSLCRRMLDRLRWASDGGDLAFLHASATHLLFEEISSILHSLTKSGESS